MKSTTLNKIYFIVIVVLAILLFTRTCKNENTLVEIPEVKKTMTTIYKDSIVYKPIFKTITKEKIVTDTIVDSELVAWLEDNLKVYREAHDSLKKENLYLKSIEPKFFTTHTTDENLDLKLTGYVSGTIHNITPKYIIKKKTIEIPKKNAFLMGGQIGQTKDFNSAIFVANLGLQNKKGNIFLIGYDTEKRINVGFLKKF